MTVQKLRTEVVIMSLIRQLRENPCYTRPYCTINNLVLRDQKQPCAPYAFSIKGTLAAPGWRLSYEPVMHANIVEQASGNAIGLNPNAYHAPSTYARGR